jgi:hypothetical protein
LLALPAACPAQSAALQPPAPRDDLLALVPADAGFCVLVNDLRGHAQKWDRAPWVQSFRETTLVKTILDAPEAQQIAALEGELKKHLGVDWPTLRDDIFGDSVVVAYRPGRPARPEQEQGMIALRASAPKRLAELVDRFNRLQKEAGELKELQPVQYLGATYHRRIHVKNTHYYYLRGPLLIVAGNEEMLREAMAHDLAKAADISPWPERFRRAGSGESLVTLGINPRAFEPFPVPVEGEKPHGFAGFWRALDGVFVTLATDPAPELRLTLQGRNEEMPSWARSLFAPPTASALWQRFPEPSILTLAARTDFANLARQIIDALPPSERRKLEEGLQGGLQLITRLDLLRDVLPNLGPDWGVCVLPPRDSTALPQMIVALAVKPGNGPEPVDDALFRGVQLLAGLAVVEHNSKNPDFPIRVETVQQGNVSVKVLVQDKLFPAGFRPSGALKDGFLLLASSPEAIARFGARAAPLAAPGEAPLLRLSPIELATMLKLRREQVLVEIRQKHQLSPQEAARALDQLLELLDLFDSVTLSQRGGAGQASWSLRVLPRARQ